MHLLYMSTAMVALDTDLNSSWTKRERRPVLPTPESPVSITEGEGGKEEGVGREGGVRMCKSHYFTVN